MSALVTFAVPREYGYVLTVTASTFFVGFWHGILVGTYRKGAGIFPPQHYAEKSDMAAAENAEKKKAMYLYNCAQRAHGNYNEYQPSVALAMLIAGLNSPVVTAGMGAAWIVSRIIYALGYTSKSKERGSGRTVGFAISSPLMVGLWGMAAWTGIKLVL